jgi:hypothetical protein
MRHNGPWVFIEVLVGLAEYTPTASLAVPVYTLYLDLAGGHYAKKSPQTTDLATFGIFCQS